MGRQRVVSLRRKVAVALCIQHMIKRKNITELLPPGSSRTGIGYGPAADLLPGWQVFLTGSPTPVDKVGLEVAGGLGIVSIYQVPPESFFEGPFYFGTAAVNWPSPRYSLVQSGEIPPDANWLSLRRSGEAVDISINGISLPLLEIPRDPNFPFRGPFGTGLVMANISAFAGQEVELKITHQVDITFTTYFDSIAFTTQMPQIPEPGSLLLWLLGGIIFTRAPLSRALKRARERSPEYKEKHQPK